MTGWLTFRITWRRNQPFFYISLSLSYSLFLTLIRTVKIVVNGTSSVELGFVLPRYEGPESVHEIWKLPNAIKTMQYIDGKIRTLSFPARLFSLVHNSSKISKRARQQVIIFTLKMHHRRWYLCWYEKFDLQTANRSISEQSRRKSIKRYQAFFSHRIVHGKTFSKLLYAYKIDQSAPVLLSIHFSLILDHSIPHLLFLLLLVVLRIL